MLSFFIVAKITSNEGLFILKIISELACLIARPIIPNQDPWPVTIFSGNVSK